MSNFEKGFNVLRKNGFIVFFRKVRIFFLNRFRKKSEFHFVKDYKKFVKNLIKVYPIDEAMSLAVGGKYFEIGNIEKDILIRFGLKHNMSLIDYGCGSGRLANALPIDLNINYLGIDIIDELLEYAKKKSPENYRFIRHRKLSVPVESESVDMICAFSLFTHLLHEESYIYMEDMKRVLKIGGRLIFSFLEFGSVAHWSIFMATVDTQRNNTSPHLNTFIEQSVIKIWADKLGFKIIELESGQGQSLAVFEKI